MPNLETARGHRKSFWDRTAGRWRETVNGQPAVPARAQNPDIILGQYDSVADDGDVEFEDAIVSGEVKIGDVAPERLVEAAGSAWSAFEREESYFGADSDSDNDDAVGDDGGPIPEDQDSDDDSDNEGDAREEKKRRPEDVVRVRLVPNVGSAKQTIMLLLVKAFLLLSSVSLGKGALLFTLLALFASAHKPTVQPLALTHHTLNTALDLGKSSFERLVVCPTCFFVRTVSDCVISRQRADGSTETDLLRCDKRWFPNHPHEARRGLCNGQLVRAVARQRGGPRIAPVLTMPYRPLLAALARLLQVPGFEELLESWRPRFAARRPGDPMIDVHDGQLWRDFQRYNGEGLLSEPGNIALAMWGDWIQTFTTNMYSLGAVMLAILNLPRSVRFDRSNIILAQAFPGGSEKLDCQKLLRPFVEDLLQLWKGVTIATAKFPEGRRIRAFLLQCLGDAPGLRKLLAFVGINAICGCFRCTVKFPSASASSLDASNKRNFYTDFDALAPARTPADLEAAAVKYRAAASPAARKDAAKETGSKDSVFLLLRYLNFVRCSPIEAMHNLYEGTGKVRPVSAVELLLDCLCCSTSSRSGKRAGPRSSLRSYSAESTRSCCPAMLAASARNSQPTFQA